MAARTDQSSNRSFSVVQLFPFAVIVCRVAICPESRIFYETVTEVNSDLRFFFVGRVLFFASVATHVVLHRVSIRTLCEPSWLCAGWGSVGEVDAASFRPAF
jgi:hypothetical protein